MEAVARPSRALKCMLPVKTVETTTARMATPSHRDVRAVSTVELLAWSDVVLGGAVDRGCSRLTQGRRRCKQSPAKPSRASSSSSAVVDDGGIQGPVLSLMLVRKAEEFR